MNYRSIEELNRSATGGTYRQGVDIAGFIHQNVFWILSIFLLGCLLVGHLQQSQPGNLIIDMSNKCEKSFSINDPRGSQYDGTHDKAAADACGKAIQKVQQGNHWEVLSNGDGGFWAEYRG